MAELGRIVSKEQFELLVQTSEDWENNNLSILISPEGVSVPKCCVSLSKKAKIKAARNLLSGSCRKTRRQGIFTKKTITVRTVTKRYSNDGIRGKSDTEKLLYDVRASTRKPSVQPQVGWKRYKINQCVIVLCAQHLYNLRYQPVEKLKRKGAEK